MARFDVYGNPSGVGYLLDVQTDLLQGLNTRMVVPLMPLDRAPRPATRLNPVFPVGDQRFAMVTQFMAAVPLAELGAPVSAIADQSHAIVDALDMLFFAF